MNLKIFVEGLPLTGKTTICKILLEYYTLKGYDVKYIEDIHNNNIGFTLKNFLNQTESDLKVNFFLSCASILKGMNEIKKNIKTYDIIIFENVLSYPILMMGLSKEKHLENIFYKFVDLLEKSNILFILECNKKEIENRKKRKNLLKFFEIYDFDELKSYYSHLFKIYNNVIKINTDKEPMEVFKEIKDIIDQYLYNF